MDKIENPAFDLFNFSADFNADEIDEHIFEDEKLEHMDSLLYQFVLWYSVIQYSTISGLYRLYIVGLYILILKTL